MRYLSRHEVNWHWTLDDEIVAALPEVSRHNEPQIGPQEYDCGCVTICRVTDRDYRRDEEPFEMRLAIKCHSTKCEYEDEYTKQLRKLYEREHAQPSGVFLLVDLIARVVCFFKGHEDPKTPSVGGESCYRCGKFWKL